MFCPGGDFEPWAVYSSDVAVIVVDRNFPARIAIQISE
jgi:hypothetical protein